MDLSDQILVTKINSELVDSHFIFYYIFLGNIINKHLQTLTVDATLNVATCYIYRKFKNKLANFFVSSIDGIDSMDTSFEI
ncbi:hypothetical protein BpHYR1_032827 [Brachionus plicatilis]|uniref:Uncharacterized protein n=1 Tax=Brachionus plicatilis TaxID=10195 RepID=A0A3M7QN09_BRAPC|nr:hypothetical protein BpHYR1_032827 [Brachionus plicatilis]